MTEADEYGRWLALDVYGSDGERIGHIADLYDDGGGAGNGTPALASVRTGLLGRRSNFVPLRGVAERDGDRAVVPYDREKVRSAPDIGEDDELTEDEVDEIYRHYGLDPAKVAAGARPAPQWRKVVRRQVVVTVVDSVDDVEALAEVLPDAVPAQELRAAAASDSPTVIVVQEREVERLVGPEERSLPPGPE
jgi:hypothetical protein